MKVEYFEVYEKDYKSKTGRFLGTVPERRNKPRQGKVIDLRGALIYARKVFGSLVSDPNSIFVIPRIPGEERKVKR